MKGDGYGQKCGGGSLGHMQSECSSEMFNPFAKGAGTEGAHQSPGGCPGTEQHWWWHLLIQPGQWWGDALTQRDSLWHLCAGRRGRRCHLRALWRRVWKARADPANEGETWASRHVLNLLSASRSSPVCRPPLRLKQMCCICLGLGLFPHLTIAQRFPTVAWVYLLEHCRGIKKQGSLCSHWAVGQSQRPAPRQLPSQLGNRATLHGHHSCEPWLLPELIWNGKKEEL